MNRRLLLALLGATAALLAGAALLLSGAGGGPNAAVPADHAPARARGPSGPPPPPALASGHEPIPLLPDGPAPDPPAGTLRGMVVDPEGRPLAGARVVLSARAAHAPPADAWEELQAALSLAERDPARTTRTGRDGAFVLAGAEPGARVLLAHADGFEPARAAVEPGGAPPRLTLQREARLVLAVVDASTRAPLPDAAAVVLRLGAADDPHDDPTGVPIPVRGEAEARLHGAATHGAGVLVAGPAGAHGHRVRVSAPGRGERVLDLPGLPPGGREEHEVALPPPSTLAGNVVDERGEPVAGAEVALERRDGFGLARRQAITDTHGRFAVADAGEGAWIVAASHVAHAKAPAQIVALQTGESRRDLVFVLARGARVGGLLLDSGGQPAAAPVLAAPAGQPGTGSASWTRSDAAGRFVLPLLPAGPTRLSAEPGAEVVVDLVPGENADVQLRLRRAPALHVRVVDRHGLPLPAAAVSLHAEEHGVWEHSDEVLAGDDGRVTFAGLRPGAHLLAARASPPGGAASSPLVLHLGWDDEREVELPLGGATLRGVALDPDGRPVPGLTLQVHPETPPGTPPGIAPGRRTASTGRDGRFAVPDLNPGAHRLHLDSDTWQPAADAPRAVLLGRGVTEVQVAVVTAETTPLDPEVTGTIR